MARSYRSSRSSGGRSPAGRSSNGRRRNGARSGRASYAAAPRKSSAGPTVVAVLVVAAVLVLVIVLASGGKKRPEATPAQAAPTASTPAAPAYRNETGKRRMPPPDLPPNLRKQAQDVVAKARELGPKIESLYQEAGRAQAAGNETLWQAKLREASRYCEQVMDAYNDLIGQMPSNDDWDEEEVANHYLGAEADVVSRALRRYNAIRKDRRQ